MVRKFKSKKFWKTSSLIEIWKDTLGRKTIRIKHNISKAFEYKIELRDLFTCPTVESLADFILRQTQMQEEKQPDFNIVSK